MSKLEDAIGNSRKAVRAERERPLKLIGGAGALADTDQLRSVRDIQLTAKSLTARRHNVDLIAQSLETVESRQDAAGASIFGEVLNDIGEECLLSQIEGAGTRPTTPVPEKPEELRPVAELAVPHPGAVPAQGAFARALGNPSGCIRLLDELESPVGRGHSLGSRTGNKRLRLPIDLLDGGDVRSPKMSLGEELLEVLSRDRRESTAGVFTQRDAVVGDVESPSTACRPTTGHGRTRGGASTGRGEPGATQHCGADGASRASARRTHGPSSCPG